MKRRKAGYRVSIYWEEFRTTAEGTMEDERTIEVDRQPSKWEMTEIGKGLESLLWRMGLLVGKKGSKLKPLPIWSLEVGDRVRLKMTTRPYPGELGKVVELRPGKYVVRLDIHRHSNIFGHYTRDELKWVKP